MYRFREIREVHLEVTTKCSVRCPQCPRTVMGSTNPTLPQVELTVDDARKIFALSFVAQLRKLTICGNYGDPTAARDLLEIVRYFRHCNPALEIQINSHGSARSISWWSDLGQLGVVCHFSIDGLEDTNPLYRRGTDWSAIMRNAGAFISAEGVAVWDYLVFEHNEHQVDAARQLSTSMGFKRFVPKKTARFVRESRVADRHPVLARDGSVSGYLRMPGNPEYQNIAIMRMSDELTTPAMYETYLDETLVTCKAVSSAGIYVSAEGLVFPCCYLAHIYPGRPYLGAEQSRDMVKALPGGAASICAFHHPIESILDGAYFQEIVPTGWSKPGGKTRMCAQQCGEIDLLAAQR